MKKIGLLLLPLMVLSSCNSPESVALAKKNLLTKDDASTKFVSFFSGSFSVISSVYNTYSKESFFVADSVSSKAKSNIVYDEGGNIVSYTSIVNDGGFAKEQYLALDNTIKTRDLSSNVSFKDNYGSPFSKIMGSVSDINNNFNITENDDGTVSYTANALGLAKASTNFKTFFTFYGDNYRWDSKSVNETVEDLVITSDGDGYPALLSFTKIKKDKYGGIKEEFTSMINKISEVPSIPTYTSPSDSEAVSALRTSLDLLSEKVAAGNFTQTIKHPYFESLEDGVYHNYYNLAYYEDEDAWGGGMLSDIPWYSSQYGVTYIGLGYSYYYGYYMIGVSPNSSYTGAVTSEYFATPDLAFPRISSLSEQFFVYNESTKEYVFDLDAFYFDDYYFDFSILDCLFGQVDAPADKFGYYLSNTDTYAMDFHQLSIKIDDAGIPEFTLVYTDSYSQSITVTTSFSDFGTTNIYNTDLAVAYDLLLGAN